VGSTKNGTQSISRLRGERGTEEGVKESELEWGGEGQLSVLTLKENRAPEQQGGGLKREGGTSQGDQRQGISTLLLSKWVKQRSSGDRRARKRWKG